MKIHEHRTGQTYQGYMFQPLMSCWLYCFRPFLVRVVVVFAYKATYWSFEDFA